MTVVQLCTRAFHKSSKILFIQDSGRALQVKSQQKHCDMKVEVFDGIPITLAGIDCLGVSGITGEGLERSAGTQI